MIYKQTERLPWRQIEGRSVIINPKAGQVHELDAVASFLWTVTDGVKTMDEVAELMIEEFDVDKNIAVQDTQEFYISLESLGLVTCQS